MTLTGHAAPVTRMTAPAPTSLARLYDYEGRLLWTARVSTTAAYSQLDENLLREHVREFTLTPLPPGTDPNALLAGATPLLPRRRDNPNRPDLTEYAPAAARATNHDLYRERARLAGANPGPDLSTGAYLVTCPQCHAEPHRGCRELDAPTLKPHKRRSSAADVELEHHTAIRQADPGHVAWTNPRPIRRA